ncbi:polysaccharide deacetylase family protein [Sporosarcina jiandibaonis]|uniref:polysaccharide deacetylase family protein n=1 Tax=Sporosarcina jiandibaonis TaxID=2715535 RepID=UPI001FEA05DA|nr:polysaccharide deacetylase family protein [Sporosarcina jiandibaonis]
MRKTHNKRRSVWIDLVFSTVILSIIILTGIIILFTSTKNEATSPLENTSNAVGTKFPILTDMIDSKYPGIKIITMISNDPDAPFALQFPESIHDSFNTKVQDYIKNIKDRYLAEIADYKALGGNQTGELNVSFETFPHHSGFYSFVLVNSTYIGDANGFTEINSFRLNPDTGQEITIEDVFEGDQKRLNMVSEVVREILFNDESYKDKLYMEEATLHTEPDWDNFQNFALTNESLVFYFNKYKIASGTAGIPIVSVPLERLNKFVAKEFKLSIENDDNNIAIDEKLDLQEEDKIIDEYPDITDDSAVSESNDNEIIEEDLAEDNEEEEIVELPLVKKVALTFDDGPDPNVTTKILASLEKYDAKATFFMLGSRVEYYPEIAKDVANAGHELGNHTWTHPDLTNSSIKKINSEITRTSSIIENVTGEKVVLFRPPYGAINKKVRQQTKLPVILWDIDTLDWKHRNAKQLLSYVKKNTRDGSIILMHDIHQSTADGLDAVLAYLESEGYTFVTVSELED